MPIKMAKPTVNAAVTPMRALVDGMLLRAYIARTGRAEARMAVMILLARSTPTMLYDLSPVRSSIISPDRIYRPSTRS